MAPDDDESQSFAALFERSPTPKRQGPRVGDVLQVTITQVGKDALFVELDGKRQGYIDVVDLPEEGGLAAFKVGDVLRARIVENEPAPGGAGMMRLQQANAPTGMPAGVTIAVGSTVTGVVSRIENYGVFLQVEGVQGRAGRGLIPNGELGVPRGTDVRKKFPEGTKLSAKVLASDDGKLRLSLRGLKDDEERAQFEAHKARVKADGGEAGTAPASPGGRGGGKGSSRPASTGGGGSLGTLGDLFNAAKKRPQGR